MSNGDRFTGEVKPLQNGLLYLQTDYVSDNIPLDWNQVQSVQSSATYRIVMNNGVKEWKGRSKKRLCTRICKSAQLARVSETTCFGV